MRRKQQSRLGIFIFVVLISGWLGVFLDRILQEEPTGDTPGMTVFIGLPLLTVIVLRFISRDWHDFGVKPRLQGNLKWYLLAIAIFPIVTILVAGSAWLFNIARLSHFETGVFFSLVVAALLPNIIIDIFEEFAWRGYLTPKLIELKVNDWLIYVIVGLVWALWHAAYFLVLMPDAYFETMSRVFYTWSGCVIMVCWAVMFVELYRITRSVWPGVLMHATQDAFPNLLIHNISDGGVMTFAKMADPWFNPLYGVMTTALFVAIGLWLRTVRIKKERSKSMNVEQTISIPE